MNKLIINPEFCTLQMEPLWCTHSFRKFKEKQKKFFIKYIYFKNTGVPPKLWLKLEHSFIILARAI